MIEVKTAECPDLEAPEKPSGLISENISTVSFDLRWNSSADNKEVSGYHIYLNGYLKQTVSDTFTLITEISCGRDYDVTVKAFDEAGNLSETSDPIVISSVECPDEEPPTAPDNLIAYNITRTTAEIRWSASIDNNIVSEYEVYRDGKPDTAVSMTKAIITGLKCDSSYLFTVKAKDEAGNISPSSDTVEVITSSCKGNSMEEYMNSEFIRVYPVPFSNQ